MEGFRTAFVSLAQCKPEILGSCHQKETVLGLTRAWLIKTKCSMAWGGHNLTLQHYLLYIDQNGLGALLATQEMQ